MKKTNNIVFAIAAATIVLFSGCSSPERIDSVSFNALDGEWVIWLERGYEDADLVMARVPCGQVRVELRSDGENRTTVRLFGCRDPVRCRYNRAVILVPTESELQYWQQRIGGR